MRTYLYPIVDPPLGEDYVMACGFEVIIYTSCTESVQVSV